MLLRREQRMTVIESHAEILAVHGRTVYLRRQLVHIVQVQRQALHWAAGLALLQGLVGQVAMAGSSLAFRPAPVPHLYCWEWEKGVLETRPSPQEGGRHHLVFLHATD